MKIETDGIAPTVESDGDKAHRIAKAAASFVPVLGGALVEAFSALIEPPLEKRKREWMLEITNAVNDLQEKFNLEIEGLAENEEFISILIHSSQVALKTHKQEKRERLKNIVINSVAQDFEFDKKMLFLNYLDQLSEYHIKMLQLIVENASKIESGNALEYDDCERFIENECLPEGSKVASYLRSQLEDMQFIDSDMFGGKGYMVLSEFGQEFYGFITTS